MTMHGRQTLSYALLDAAAVGLITHDVAILDDDELSCDTPCVGWNVAELVRHMNEEHEAIIATVLGPAAHTSDLRRDFTLSAARWSVALAQAGPNIEVPKMHATVDTQAVMATHFVDMLVHRWDIAMALGNRCHASATLTQAAIPVAQLITVPESPLVGTVYADSVPPRPGRSPLDALAALLGRDPERWAGAVRDGGEVARGETQPGSTSRRRVL